MLPAGTLVGELAMLIETEHGSTVKASGAVNALKFSRQMMHELMQRYPGMAEHFTAKIRSRLERMAEALREIDEMLDAGDMLEATGARAPGDALRLIGYGASCSASAVGASLSCASTSAEPSQP